MRLALALLVAAVAASPALAERELPWVSGPDVESATEAKLGQVVSELAGVPASVLCWDEAGWAVRTGGDNPLGLTNVAAHRVELSPDSCWYLDSFLAAQPRLYCGFKTVYRTVRKRLRLGQWVVVRKRVAVRVPAKPICPEIEPLRRAAWTLGHEVQHVKGILDEGIADCYGRQTIAAVLERLGATKAYAAAVQAWDFPVIGAPAECRQDGALDLTPGDGRWP